MQGRGKRSHRIGTNALRGRHFSKESIGLRATAPFPSLLAFPAVAAFAADAALVNPVVVGHRGACAYLPEHTLEGKAMAHAMGVDYVEQDVVMTRDNELVVIHDHLLETVTDVARKFPGRARKDGHGNRIHNPLSRWE